MAQTIFDFQVKTIRGEETTLEPWRDQVMLIVNLASRCGFTPQYEGLEKLYRTYKDRGFAILGFPCNQFLAQEPGNEAEIAMFCSITYDVTFPLFSKIDVNGKDTHPLFTYLKHEAPGIMGSEAIKWNFTKFLVDRKGNVVDRYASATAPIELEPIITGLL